MTAPITLVTARTCS